MPHFTKIQTSDGKIVTGTLIGDKVAADVNVIGSAAGFTSINNSSNVALTGSATFTGVGEQNNYAQVGVMLKTDADCTLYFDFSNDGTNWDSTFPVAGFAVSASISEFHTAVKLGRYFRLRLVNGAAAQTYLRLTTYYGNDFVPSVAPANQSIGIDSDALTTRPTIFIDEVHRGLRSGVTAFNKFAFRSGLSASAGEETLWATTGNFVPMTTASTFTITFNSGTDGLGTTGALSLYIYYIDSNGLAQEALHTLSNTGSEVTAFSGLGINRVIVNTSGTALMNTNDITITETTGGTTQAALPALNGVSQQAIFFVDANSTAVAKNLWFNINKLSGGGAPRVTIKGYVYNRGTDSAFEVFRATVDTGVENTVYINEPVGFKLSATSVLYFVADTDTSNTIASLRFSLLEYKID